MKTVYFIYNKRTHKWDWTAVRSGNKLANSANQGYSRKRDCKKVFYNNFGRDWKEKEVTREQFKRIYFK